MKKFNDISGFTLLELVMTLAIIGVVAGVAVPTFKSMLLRDNVASLNNELMLSLKRARSEAIARGADVTMCSSTDGAGCSGAAGNWEKGWVIYEDINSDGSASVDELIWVQNMEALQDIVVEASASFDTEIVFSDNGTLAGGVAGFLRTCSGLGATNGLERRDINVDVSGAPVYQLNGGVKC